MTKSYRVLNPDGSVSRCYTGPGCRLHDSGIKAYTTAFQKPSVDTVDVATFRQEFEANLRDVPVPATSATVAALTQALRASNPFAYGKRAVANQINALTDPDSIRAVAENTPVVWQTTAALLLNPNTPSDILDARSRHLSTTGRRQILGSPAVPIDTVRLILDTADDDQVVADALPHLPQGEARELATTGLPAAEAYITKYGWPENDILFELAFAELARNSHNKTNAILLAEHGTESKSHRVAIDSGNTVALTRVADNPQLGSHNVGRLLRVAMNQPEVYNKIAASLRRNNGLLPTRATAEPLPGKPNHNQLTALTTTKAEAKSAARAWFAEKEHGLPDQEKEFLLAMHMNAQEHLARAQAQVDAHEANYRALGQKFAREDARYMTARDKNARRWENRHDLKERYARATVLLEATADIKAYEDHINPPRSAPLRGLL